MIRPFTCVCLLMAAGSGLYLYSAKHQMQLLDRDIAKLVRTAQDSRTKAQMLHAEYDLLGDPDRLRELSSQVLTLQTTAPTQFTTLADLDRRLPPVGLPPTPQPDPAETPAPVAAAPPAEKTSDRIAEKAPDKTPEKTAEKAPERPIVVAQPVLPPVRPQPRPQVAQAAEPTPPPRPRPPTPLAVASVEPTRALPPPTALARPVPVPHVAPPVPPYAAIKRPRPEYEASAPSEAVAPMNRVGTAEPPIRAMPVVASALGMARTMMASPSQLGAIQAQPISAAMPGALSQVRR